MGKYYVSSGTLNVIVSRGDALEAALAALSMTNKLDVISEYFYVDERGYRSYISADNDTKVISSKIVVDILQKRG